MSLLSRLQTFLDSSPTPFHAVINIKTRLIEAGFTPLFESQPWKLEQGKRYFVTRNDTSIIAFCYEDAAKTGWHIVGAHTDSPTLKIKPNPDVTKAGVHQIGVEVYGGALLNPWFDRDLSVAGRVSFLDQTGTLKHELIDFKVPMAVIPSLAIHLDREANSAKSVHAQNHLPPVLGLDAGENFSARLGQKVPHAQTILGHDLFLYDTQKAAVIGPFLASARLDNLLSTFCAMEALVESRTQAPSLIAFHDHEEVGSSSYHGAQSNFLEQVLSRITPDAEARAQALCHTYMVSTDNAHALHPNYMELHEPNHAPLIGQGVALKYHANQSYASDSVSASYLLRYAQKAGIKTQSYVVRSDLRCGSTIGPITATKLGIKTVDIGVPTWAMHSVRETAACQDVQDLYALLTAFFKRSDG